MRRTRAAKNPARNPAKRRARSPPTSLPRKPLTSRPRLLTRRRRNRCRPAHRQVAAGRPVPATKKGGVASLRKWLLSGLLVIVPVAITVAVLNWIVGTLDKTLLILPQTWQPDRLIGFH